MSRMKKLKWRQIKTRLIMASLIILLCGGSWYLDQKFDQHQVISERQSTMVKTINGLDNPLQKEVLIRSKELKYARKNDHVVALANGVYADQISSDQMPVKHHQWVTVYRYRIFNTTDEEFNASRLLANEWSSSVDEQESLSQRYQIYGQAHPDFMEQFSVANGDLDNWSAGQHLSAHHEMDLVVLQPVERS